MSEHTNTAGDEGRGPVNGGVEPRGEGREKRVSRRGFLRAAGAGVALAGASVASQSVAAETTLAGSGTDDDPYLIEDGDDLDSVREDLTAHYEVTADIDLSGAEWTPIGTEDTPFTGVLDGSGYTIDALTIDESASHTALIAATDGATIRDVDLTGVDVTGGDHTAAVAGEAVTTTIDTVTVAGSVDGEQWTAGVVGHVTGGDVTEVVNDATVAGGSSVGGVAGYIHDGTTVEDACNHGTINAGSKAGGIAGTVSKSEDPVTFMRVVSNGDVRGHTQDILDAGDGGWVGGIIGDAAGVDVYRATVHDCVVESQGPATGGVAGRAGEDTALEAAIVTDSTTVDGYEKVGGIVGNSAGTVTRSESRAIVTAQTDGNTMLGGIAGRSAGSDVTDVIAAGTVDAPTDAQQVAGLIGFTGANEPGTTVTRAVAATEVTGDYHPDYTGDVIGSVWDDDGEDDDISVTYYDETLNEELDAVGELPDGATEYVDTTPETTSDMQGSSASVVMDDLDWAVFESREDAYPVVTDAGWECEHTDGEEDDEEEEVIAGGGTSENTNRWRLAPLAAAGGGLLALLANSEEEEED